MKNIKVVDRWLRCQQRATDCGFTLSINVEEGKFEVRRDNKVRCCSRSLSGVESYLCAYFDFQIDMTMANAERLINV